MKKWCLLLFMVSYFTVKASEIEVYLPCISVPERLVSVYGVGGKPTCRPEALGLMADGYFEFPNPEQHLAMASNLVIATIEEVVPLAVTGIEDVYHGSTALSLTWYRVRCTVQQIVRGDFSADTLSFVVSVAGEGPFWPYVKGYTYYFILEKPFDDWQMVKQFRTSSIPPYQRADRVPYHQLKKMHPEFDWTEMDTRIATDKQNLNMRLMDVSVEHGTHLITTFINSGVGCGRQYDYGQGAIILTNDWIFPLPKEF